MLFKETKIFVLIYIKDIYIPSIHTTHTYTCVYIYICKVRDTGYFQGRKLDSWLGRRISTVLPFYFLNFELRDYITFPNNKLQIFNPGQVAQMVRALSRYAKVAGSIPGQGTCKNQSMNA